MTFLRNREQSISDRILKLGIKMAEDASKLSNCPRAKCGCVALIKDDEIVQTISGYNHHVGDENCELVDNHCVSAVHAEVDMIHQSMLKQVSLWGATIISLEYPCQRCMVELANCKVDKVYYRNNYHAGKHGDEYLSPTLIKLLKLEKL